MLRKTLSSLHSDETKGLAQSICRLPSSSKFATCVENLSECATFRKIEKMKTEGNVTAAIAEAHYKKFKTCTNDEVEFCFLNIRTIIDNMFLFLSLLL